MTASQQQAHSVFVVAEHPLAGEYLVQILRQDRTARPVLCKELPSIQLKANLPIFVIDEFLSLPIREFVRRLRIRFASSKFIIVCRSGERADTVRMLKMGVHGIVPYPKVANSLQLAVHKVSRGELWIASEVLQSYVQLTQQGRNHPEGVVDRLTAREGEILELVKLRRTNKEIAAILRLQESTVKFHISNAFSKLRIGRRQELVGRSEYLRIWNELELAK